MLDNEFVKCPRVATPLKLDSSSAVQKNHQTFLQF